MHISVKINDNYLIFEELSLIGESTLNCDFCYQLTLDNAKYRSFNDAQNISGQTNNSSVINNHNKTSNDLEIETKKNIGQDIICEFYNHDKVNFIEGVITEYEVNMTPVKGGCQVVIIIESFVSRLKINSQQISHKNIHNMIDNMFFINDKSRINLFTIGGQNKINDFYKMPTIQYNKSNYICFEESLSNMGLYYFVTPGKEKTQLSIFNNIANLPFVATSIKSGDINLANIGYSVVYSDVHSRIFVTTDDISLHAGLKINISDSRDKYLIISNNLEATYKSKHHNHGENLKITNKLVLQVINDDDSLSQDLSVKLNADNYPGFHYAFKQNGKDTGDQLHICYKGFEVDLPAKALFSHKLSSTGWGEQWMPQDGAQLLICYLNSCSDNRVITGGIYSNQNKVPKDLNDYNELISIVGRDCYQFLSFDDNKSSLEIYSKDYYNQTSIDKFFTQVNNNLVHKVQNCQVKSLQGGSSTLTSLGNISISALPSQISITPTNIILFASQFDVTDS